jgi:hypothetical protein
VTADAARWRPVVAALLSLELLKHAGLLSLGLAQPWSDSPLYWQLAADAAAGDVWLAKSAQAFRTPGYPWWLAVWRGLCGPVALVAVVLGQHLVVLATSWVTALLTLRVTRSAAAALAAWSLCAISTARPLFANWVLTETLATALLTVAVWRLIVACDAGRLRPVLTGAAWLGLGVLVRPSLLAAAPALVVAGWIVARRQSWPVRRCLLAAVAGPAVLAVCLLPWCLRNAVQFDRFSLTVFAGRELWTAHFSPWPGGELPIPTDAAGAELRPRIAVDAVDLRHNISVSNALRESGLNDAQTDALMERVSWQAIAANPGRAAFRTFARCATFWYVKDWEIDVTQDVSSPDGRGFDDAQWRWMSSPLQPAVIAALRWTPERWFPAMWAWSVVTWLGILMMVVNRDQRPVGMLLAVILASTTVLTAALEIPLYRYRCVLEPLMIVATVAAGQAMVRSVRRPMAA